MSKLFFIISGEHPTLPKAEIKAILEAENCSFRIIESVPKLLVVEAQQDCLKNVSHRSSMCKISGICIARSSINLPDIYRTIRDADLSKILQPGDSFSVRIVKADRSHRTYNSEILEAKIGGILKQIISNLSVDLIKPKKPLLGILYKGGFILGIQKYQRELGSLASRRPRKRPVFHPSTLPPKLARCMTNLARPKKGDILLDPFCGVGGILIEANLIGCRTIGCDLRRGQIQGAFANIKHFGLQSFGMIVSDARVPVIKRVDVIVTDPPYGTAASTHGSTISDILDRFFIAAYDITSPKSYICIGSPKSVQIDLIGSKAGFDLLESHEIYVHRSLTREIAVFQRK